MLPADVRQLWELLRGAVLHYCRPANLGAGFQAARKQAAKDMFAFAQQLEQRGYPDYLFTWNLHWAVCQLPVQEEARGSAAASAEWWTERLMQTYKNLVGGRVTHGSEQVRSGKGVGGPQGMCGLCCGDLPRLYQQRDGHDVFHGGARHHALERRPVSDAQ